MNKKAINTAIILAWITILYNIVEGLVSISFGIEDETIALAGFGIDSFVEVISGLGILHMLYNFKKEGIEKKTVFEKKALRITAFAFFLLSLSLIISGLLNFFITHNQPESTVAGIVISLISILTMYFLMSQKIKVGKILSSKAILADANCTKVCIILSFSLLIVSLIYRLFEIPYIDTVGGFIIAYYCIKEGKEALINAKSDNVSCCSCSSNEKCE